MQGTKSLDMKLITQLDSGNSGKETEVRLFLMPEKFSSDSRLENETAIIKTSVMTVMS